MKKVTATFCLETPACGRGRVAFGDRQKVAVTFFVPSLQIKCDPCQAGWSASIFAARMKSFSERPPTAWVWISIHARR